MAPVGLLFTLLLYVASETVALLFSCCLFLSSMICLKSLDNFYQGVFLKQLSSLFQTRTEGFHSLGVDQSFKKLLKHEGVLGFYK